MSNIKDESTLRSRYQEVHPLALTKSRPKLDRFSRQFIGMSPFLVISTANATGKADISPRGDPPGFVHIVDDSSILVPDRPGNNRLDTLANILENPNVGCLFFVPGFDDTLRLNGRAQIIENASLLHYCTIQGKKPKIGILIEIDEVFIHCAKALRRSKLWGGDYLQDRTQMPSIARIILEQTTEIGIDEAIATESDEDVERDYKEGLW